MSNRKQNMENKSAIRLVNNVLISVLFYITLFVMFYGATNKTTFVVFDYITYILAALSAVYAIVYALKNFSKKNSTVVKQSDRTLFTWSVITFLITGYISIRPILAYYDLFVILPILFVLYLVYEIFNNSFFVYSVMTAIIGAPTFIAYVKRGDIYYTNKAVYPIIIAAIVNIIIVAIVYMIIKNYGKIGKVTVFHNSENVKYIYTLGIISIISPILTWLLNYKGALIALLTILVCGIIVLIYETYHLSKSKN